MKDKKQLPLEQKEKAVHGERIFPLKKYLTTLQERYPIVTPHWHEEAEFTLITSGVCTYQVDLESFQAMPGDFVFIPPLALHSIAILPAGHMHSETYVFHLDFLGASSADICAMRHPKEGAPLCASMYATIPVINAGDGGHYHPTQTLIDLLTIRQRKGRLDHLTVGFCGDLKFGRTVHSLVNSLVRYPGNEFYFISPEELRIPDYMIERTLKPSHSTYREVSDLEETLPKLDVLYMTRVQKERFFNEEDYIRLKDTYILNKEKLELASSDMPVLHPLPRVDEISVDVDSDPRAAYFQQVQNGKYVRMALILALLEITDPLTGEKVL